MFGSFGWSRNRGLGGCERVADNQPAMENTTLSPPDTATPPTLRQQLDSLPAHIVSTWRSRYANDGTELEARAIIGREAVVVRATGQEADALAMWVRLADAAGRMREIPPALGAAAALAGLAAGIRTQGYFEAPSKADLAP